MEAPAKQVTPVAINEIYDRYLRTISQFSFLTGTQLTRRLYKMGMRTTVMARLKTLTDAGYLHALWLPTTRSKSPHIYTLAAKGVKYLRDEGLEVEVTYKPSELKELSHSFLWHILELNDFLISAYLLEREKPEYHVQAMYHDLTLKKKPIEIPSSAKSSAGKPKTIVPDAFLDIRMNPGGGKRQRQYCLWVELDRGTEQTTEHFKQKIRNLMSALLTSTIQDYFSVKQLSAIVFPTTAGEKRVEQMRKWTSDVLIEVKAPTELTSLFLFTSCAQELTPTALFLTPLWLTPIHPHAVSLFA